MPKVKRRKPRPQPPYHYWLDADGCWFCNNPNGCGGCKFLKEYIATESKRKKIRDEKRYWGL